MLSAKCQMLLLEWGQMSVGMELPKEGVCCQFQVLVSIWMTGINAKVLMARQGRRLIIIQQGHTKNFTTDPFVLVEDRVKRVSLLGKMISNVLVSGHLVCCWVVMSALMSRFAICESCLLLYCWCCMPISQLGILVKFKTPALWRIHFQWYYWVIEIGNCLREHK